MLTSVGYVTPKIIQNNSRYNLTYVVPARYLVRFSVSDITK